MTLDDASLLTNALWVVGAAIVIYIGAMWLASLVWVAGDIQRRTTSQALQVGAVAMTALLWLPGLLMYFVLRPRETLAERAEHQLELQAIARQAESSTCTRCYRRLREDFLRCPFCAQEVGIPCASCERVNEPSWVVCPYCGEDKRVRIQQQETTVTTGAPRTAPRIALRAPVASARNGHSTAR